MELSVLKKKLSSFKGDGGRIRNVSDELLLEVLSEWEQWTGTTREFYKGIGISHKGMASMIGKAKRLKRKGHSNPFHEISAGDVSEQNCSFSPVCNVEVQENNKIIRFGNVDLLIEYLKKVA